MKLVHTKSVSKRVVDGHVMLLLKTEDIVFPKEIGCVFNIENDVLKLDLATEKGSLCYFELPGLDKTLLSSIDEQQRLRIDQICENGAHYQFHALNMRVLR